MNRYSFKLYIAGQTSRSRFAIANLQRLCDHVLSGQYELMVIDVTESAQLAEKERIVATPTLVKEAPPPVQRIIGDLSDQDKVLLALGLSSYTETQ